MRAKTIILPGIFLLNVLTIYAQETTILKKRIAVMDFEDKSGSQTFGAKDLGGTYNSYRSASAGVSRKLTDELTTELSKSGAFQLIEREQLDKVFNEQNLGSSGNVTAQSAAKAGQILGVQFLVTGSITEYGEKRDVTSTNYIYYSTQKISMTARVVVDIRLINTSTGEILISESAVGEENNTTKSNTFKSAKSATSSLTDMAERKALEHCIEIIKRGSAKTIWEGKVLKVNEDGSVFMKPGSSCGVKANMTFTVYSKGTEIKDPDTGLSLGFDLKKEAEITIVGDIGTDGSACKARVTSGSGVKDGDVVRVN